MSNEGQPLSYKHILWVYINASQKNIWDAITKAEWTQQFGYGWRIEYDLRPGGGFWVFTSEMIKQNGAISGIKVPDLMFKGDVVEMDAPHLLTLQWKIEFDPLKYENSITNLTFEIAEVHDGFSKLTLTFDKKYSVNFPLIQPVGMINGFEGFEWRLILCDLKSLLETGKGFMI